MHVGVPLVGVKCHRIAVLQSKFLRGELPDSRVHLVGRCALRHREHQVVHQLRGLASHRHRPLRVAAVLVQVEVPVFHERFLEPLLLEPGTVIGFNDALSLSTDVIKVSLHTSHTPCATGDLNHHFWDAPGSSGDMFDLGPGQRPMPRSPPAIGRDIQEGALLPKVNDTLGHTRSPRKRYSPGSIPSRDRAMPHRRATRPEDPGRSNRSPGRSDWRLWRSGSGCVRSPQAQPPTA